MSIRKSPFLKDRIIPASPQLHKSPQYSKSVLQTMESIGDHHGYEHARWRDLNPLYTSQLKSFAIVRNPWDRVVSRYFFAKKVIEVEKKEPKGKHAIESFEAFLEERHIWGNKRYMWHRAIRGWFPSYDYVTDNDGKIQADILRFENYNDDVCAYFKIPEMSRARNVTALNPGTYKDVYTNKTRQIVADWYAKDIETFGYDYDTGPTKNCWAINNKDRKR